MLYTNLSNDFEVLRYVTVLSSGMTAGASLYLCTTTMEAIAKAPLGVALTQWSYVFDTGTKYYVPTIGVNTVMLGFLAYKYHSLHMESWSHFLIAGVVALTWVPFTKVCMWNNIKWLRAKSTALAGLSSDVPDKEEVETRQRLIRYRNDHAVRTVLLFVSFAMSAFSALYE